jgi:hypothetical protein
MTRIPHGLTVVLAMSVAAGTGCNRDLPLPNSPTVVPTTTSAPVTTSIVVTNGWTGLPVAGAKVTGDGVDAMTDAAGRVNVTAPPATCVRVTVSVTGFLERRTCTNGAITLWPIASDAEMEATKAAVFINDRLISYSGGPTEVVLPADIRAGADSAAIWTRAADQLRAATSGRLSVTFPERIADEGFVVSPAGVPAGCDHPWFTWSFSVAGFCWGRTQNYFVQNILVGPESIERPEVALRVLLYAFTMRQHSSPGIMNTTQPGTELSEFERKTLHMTSLRLLNQVGWPDFDVPK